MGPEDLREAPKLAGEGALGGGEEDPEFPTGAFPVRGTKPVLAAEGDASASAAEEEKAENPRPASPAREYVEG